MNLNDYMDYLESEMYESYEDDDDYDDYYESELYDEYDKIQVLREAVEDKFINDEIDYEEYAMLNDRLDEREMYLESIYYEKNAIEKEKDPYIQAKKRLKQIFHHNGKRGTIIVNGVEHKITFNRQEPTKYTVSTDTINFGEDIPKKWTDNDLKYRIFHELGHKKSLKFDKKLSTSGDISHLVYTAGKMHNVDFKSPLSKIEKMLKGDKSITRQTIKEEYPYIDESDFGVLFKFCKSKIEAERTGRKDDTKEKIDDYIENNYKKYKNNSHFNSEEVIADEYARKHLGYKNTRKAIKRLYNASATDHANLFKRLAIKMRSRELKDEDDIRYIKAAFGRFIPEVSNIENMSYEERLKLAATADKIADDPFIRKTSAKSGKRFDNKFVNLLDKNSRDDRNARKKLLKDKKFRDLINGKNKKDIDKKFADKASKNKR